MNKHLKTIIGCVLIAAVMLSLAACGSKTDSLETTSAVSEETVTQATTEEATEVTTEETSEPAEEETVIETETETETTFEAETESETEETLSALEEYKESSKNSDEYIWDGTYIYKSVEDWWDCDYYVQVSYFDPNCNGYTIMMVLDFWNSTDEVLECWINVWINGEEAYINGCSGYLHEADPQTECIDYFGLDGADLTMDVSDIEVITIQCVLNDEITTDKVDVYPFAEMTE